ncbi:PilT/PilU family type 4a pilus ATPase [Serpentinimonas barnesii]|uniref:PilT/PilU family type 4a pilus ATPase n=1 Tax=Serpentinimonas barnesii TaxID=1458427 RepID=UPI000496415E|nr:PilT/PilU family type 4a pilus ATPase [Serpentinimonas barnesii]
MGPMEKILRLMSERKASDVYLSAASPVQMKFNGVCTPITPQPLPVDGPLQLLAEVVSEAQLQEFHASGELNVAIPMTGVGRFRLSAMKQRGNCAVVARFISSEIPAFESLQLPPVLAQMIMAKRGLMLVVGSTGSGKSTTLAALLDHRNARSSGHILTIEDPVEYLFRNKLSIVNQREVGTDTASLYVALKNALRQAPDVILIGEIRDRETMSLAIAYAQSGHLVLATLHANNSHQALNRILNFFPVEVRPTMLNDLASSLKAIVSQRLLRTVDGARVPAVEVMINSRLMSELIEKGDFFGVREALEKSMSEESQTFESDIARLILEGKIDRQEGLAHADSPTNLMWRLQNQSVQARSQSSTDRAATPAQTPAPTGPSFSDFKFDA